MLLVQFNMKISTIHTQKNIVIETEADNILDFTEINPFGEF